MLNERGDTGNELKTIDVAFCCSEEPKRVHSSPSPGWRRAGRHQTKANKGNKGRRLQPLMAGCALHLRAPRAAALPGRRAHHRAPARGGGRLAHLAML